MKNVQGLCYGYFKVQEGWDFLNKFASKTSKEIENGKNERMTTTNFFKSIVAVQNAFSILSAIGANKRLIERVKSAVPRVIKWRGIMATQTKTLHLGFVASSVFRNSVNAV